MIQSPRYPNQYPRSTVCEWVIDFGYGIDVTFEFTVFDLESSQDCSYDYVTLHKGINKTGEVMGEQYCGMDLPPSRTVNGPLTIYFKSDFDTEFPGFSAEYSTAGECNSSILVHVIPSSTCPTRVIERVFPNIMAIF